MSRALIDGGLIYRCCFATEKTVYRFYWNGQAEDIKGKRAAGDHEADMKASHLNYNVIKVKIVEPLSHCLHLINNMIEGIRDKYGDDMVIYLDPADKSNYRNKIATLPGPHGMGYKAGRASRPFYYSQARKHLIDKWAAVEVHGQEADDAMAIEHCTSDDKTVICTFDKDLDMIPGLHYNFIKKQEYTIDEITGLRNFYKQFLTGDAADNIAGIRGIGPVKASKLIDHLTTEADMAHIVIHQYMKKHQGDFHNCMKEVVEKGQLLWIRRKPNELWTVPDLIEGLGGKVINNG